MFDFAWFYKNACGSWIRSDGSYTLSTVPPRPLPQTEKGLWNLRYDIKTIVGLLALLWHVLCSPTSPLKKSAHSKLIPNKPIGYNWTKVTLNWPLHEPLASFAAHHFITTGKGDRHRRRHNCVIMVIDSPGPSKHLYNWMLLRNEASVC